MKHTNKKRLFSLVASAVMVVSLFSGNAFAEGEVCPEHGGNSDWTCTWHEGTKELICNQEEHAEHDNDCWQLLCTEKEHTHTDACYETGISCTQEEHTHTSACHEDVLSCGKEVHEHTTDCYHEVLHCTETAHTHTDACHEVKVCDKEEHTHADKRSGKGQFKVSTVSCEPYKVLVFFPYPHYETKTTCKHGEFTNETNPCYDWVLDCNKDERYDGPHDESCYKWKLVCTKENHIHSDACQYDKIVCGLGEHEHTANCYHDELNCTKEVHTHSDNCYTDQITCGKTEHTHDATCEYRNLICEEKEHTHDNTCYGYVDEIHVHTDACYRVTEGYWTHEFTPVVVPDINYTSVTVNYLDKETGDSIASAYRKTVVEGASYDVAAQTAVEIDGYQLDSVSGEVAGRAYDAVVINVYYSAVSEVIDEPDTPLAPTPGEEIGDEDVPLIDAPQTGEDTSVAVVSILSVALIGGLYLLLKRKAER